MDRPPLRFLSQLLSFPLRCMSCLILSYFVFSPIIASVPCHSLLCLVLPYPALPYPYLLNLASSYFPLPSCPTLLNPKPSIILHYSLRIPLKTISKVRAMPKDGLPFPGTTHTHTQSYSHTQKHTHIRTHTHSSLLTASLCIANCIAQPLTQMLPFHSPYPPILFLS